jgi:hypothetical protein
VVLRNCGGRRQCSRISTATLCCFSVSSVRDHLEIPKEKRLVGKR